MYAALTYGFPLILLVFEWGLRTLLLVDSRGFTGPTLAAAALSFLVPLTRPKILKVHVPGAPTAVVMSKADHQFVAFAWFLVLVFLFVWSTTCYLSVKYPDRQTIGVSTHFALGLCAYVFSLMMTFVKEKV